MAGTAPITPQALECASAIVERWLRGVVCEQQWPGLAAGIVHGDRIALLRGYGHADRVAGILVTPDTPFHIASISKTFTAIAIMRLAEAGGLRLDDRIADHVPWFGAGAPEVQRRTTVRHLLTHTGGVVRDGDAFWDTDEFPDAAGLRRIAGAECGVIPPVLRIKYSNVAYGVLGAVIEAVTGMEYREHLRREIVVPLGLASTWIPGGASDGGGVAIGYGRRDPGGRRETFAAPGTGALAAATGLASTVRDLCTYMIAQFDGDETLLSDDAKREMRRVHWDRPAGGERQAIGYQLRTEHGFSLSVHTGGFPGHRSVLMFDPVQRLGVTVLINAIDAQPRAVAVAMLHIIRVVIDRWDEFAGGAVAAELEGCVGDYAGRWETGHVVRINRQLAWITSTMDAPLQDAYRMEPLGSGRFLMVGDGLYGSHSEVAAADIRDGQASGWDFAGSRVSRWDVPVPTGP